MGQVVQSGATLLQTGAGITKWDIVKEKASTGFYMIGISVTKELNLFRKIYVFVTIHIIYDSFTLLVIFRIAHNK